MRLEFDEIFPATAVALAVLFREVSVFLSHFYLYHGELPLKIFSIPYRNLQNGLKLLVNLFAYMVVYAVVRTFSIFSEYVVFVGYGLQCMAVELVLTQVVEYAVAVTHLVDSTLARGQLQKRQQMFNL